MAVVRIFQTGFEDGTIEQNLDSAYAVTTTWPRTGCYHAVGYYLNPITKRIPPASAVQISFGFAHRQNLSSASFSWIGTSGELLGRVVYDRSVDRLTLRILNTTVASAAGVTYGLPTENAYTSWGLDLRISTASDGWASFWVDGNPVFQFYGPTAASPSKVAQWVWALAESGPLLFVDDLLINLVDGEPSPETPPNRFFVFLRPQDQGAYSQWLGSDQDSASNYLLVDERPINYDTDFVSASTPGLKDSYRLFDYTLPPQRQIAAVIPVAYARKLSVEDPIELRLFLRISGSDFAQSACGLLGTAYRMLWARYPVHPGTGSPWTSGCGLEMGLWSEGEF